MRQQLRLRVLLPLAVLGLLGAGFGAYAFGQAPEPASEPLPPTTTKAAPAKPKAPGPVGRKAWAAEVNALCAKRAAALKEFAFPKHPRPQVLENFISEAVKSSADFNKALASLGWPRGERRAFLGVRTALARETALGRSALKAFRTYKLARLERTMKRIADGGALGTEMRRLGARKCANLGLAGAAEIVEKANGKRSVGKLPPNVLLDWALFLEPAAVVLFYTPESGLDGTTVLEARSAALDTRTAFLPVNVKVNGEVSKLAERYDVSEAPAILVFARGPSPRLIARFDRFADRQTVAQAVENALR